MTHKNEATWKQANHIFGPIGAGYLDVLTLALHVDGKFMKEQHLRDIEAYPPPTPISSRDTVPDWFAESYKAVSSAF